MTTLTALCHDVEAAKRAFAAMEAAGVPPGLISVLARGMDVDRKLIDSPERNANLLAPATRPPASGLARKLSGEKKFLLEGCWAAGPLFEESAERTGEQGKEHLARALLRAGIGLKEEAEIESAIKGRGGVWLAVREEEGKLQSLEEKLRAAGCMKVSRFALS